MRIRNFVALILCFVLALVATGSAQESNDTKRKPEPIKVFQIGKVSDRAYKTELNKFWKSYDPTTDQLYIINYGSDHQIARREKLITNSITFRHYDRSRITLVRGGNTGSGPDTVFWKIPPGAGS